MKKQSTGNIELQIEKSSRWPGMAFPTPGNRIPDAWEPYSQPVGNAPLQSGRHLHGRVGLAPCTHLLHCSWLWRRKFPASRPITLRTYMNARLPAMRKATICCFCIQRSISPCKTDRGRGSPSPLASAKAGRQCGICPYPITMDITAERRDVNTPCPRTDISILLQCVLFLLHITAEDTVDLRTLFPVKRIVRLDQPAVVNLDGL